MVLCEGFWFVLLGDCVLVTIVCFLIILDICDVYIGLILQGFSKLLSLDSPCQVRFPGLHVCLDTYIPLDPLVRLCVIVPPSIQELPLETPSLGLGMQKDREACSDEHIHPTPRCSSKRIFHES